ncbi:MAG: hypothetical protein ACOX5J_05005 [Candidatus Hydrogenedentales bacterium]|jgi:hypothetical protein
MKLLMAVLPLIPMVTLTSPINHALELEGILTLPLPDALQIEYVMVQAKPEIPEPELAKRIEETLQDARARSGGEISPEQEGALRLRIEEDNLRNGNTSRQERDTHTDLLQDSVAAKSSTGRISWSFAAFFLLAIPVSFVVGSRGRENWWDGLGAYITGCFGLLWTLAIGLFGEEYFGAPTRLAVLIMVLVSVWGENLGGFIRRRVRRTHDLEKCTRDNASNQH